MNARRKIIKRLEQDLIGPQKADETISDRPSDRYLTGILFPLRTGQGAEQDDDSSTAEDEGETGIGKDAVALSNSFRPSSAGISFAIKPSAQDDFAAISLTVSCARYIEVDTQDDRPSGEEEEQYRPKSWKRKPKKAVLEIALSADEQEPDTDLADSGISGMKLHIRTSNWNDVVLVTVAVSNAQEIKGRLTRAALEEASFFQVGLRVEPACGSRVVPRPDTTRQSGMDEESRSASLIYRRTAEYAVGHTCSASWAKPDEQARLVDHIATSWIPEAFVSSVSATGDEVFRSLDRNDGIMPLSARWLSVASDEELVSGLLVLPERYECWINKRAKEIKELSADLKDQAELHLQNCRKARKRIEHGIAMIRDHKDIRDAFRLANRAIYLQQTWKAARNPKLQGDLTWRPFQLAFALLSLASASDAKDPDRKVMDLLWFPTGGGKTEAYLLLTAHIIFLRRIHAEGGEAGNGIAVFMRYTLRLLTIQQFQRAAALICACDLIRDGSESSGSVRLPASLQNETPISIGLWVGNSSSPNKVKDAIDALENEKESSPAQLSRCPSCDSKLKWAASPARDRIEVRCENKTCILGGRDAALPVWTVDEDIYRELPSLLIATADKYAQIARKREVGRLFGIDTPCSPPDLIIQDELHLISGPLGTLAGIYEIAVDEMCSHAGARPKIVGSTATIRQADQQISALFDREAFQFPPPGLDQDNSAFSVVDRQAPGRIYLGITTAGRSAKFALQAVAASLLQAATDTSLSEKERDYYWTLVTYFNSLRELGGALVLMRDDVERSIDQFAARNDEVPRDPAMQIELTSRVDSSDIPSLLDQLDARAGSDDCVDIVLASNMISVGVDVSRLGLMLVNGQPKSIAEYIQATSRVGRGSVPGLIISVYNANKARDRSRYETFKGWHQSLYRDVEATSVSPFAPRARDRALHAAFVSMARHLIPGMQGEPVDARPFERELREIIDRIVERAQRIDPEEADDVRAELEAKLQEWLDAGKLNLYWDDYRRQGLMMSADEAAEQVAAGRGKSVSWPTLNSLRSVEASVQFILLNGLAVQKGDTR